MTALRYSFTIFASALVGLGSFLTAVLMMTAISTTLGSASMTGVPQEGMPAPDFELRDLSGKSVRLSELSGRPAVIVFWADWCADCKRIVPELNRMHLEGVPVIGVNLMEDRARVLNAVEDLPIRYPVVLDTDGEVGRAYGVEALPNIFMIDADGKVARHTYNVP